MKTFAKSILGLFMLNVFFQNCSFLNSKHSFNGKYSIEKENNSFNNSRSLLKGEVLDFKTKLPLKFANVLIQGSKYGTKTDSLGMFEIAVPFGYYKILIRNVGNTDMITKPIFFDSTQIIIVKAYLGAFNQYQQFK